MEDTITLEDIRSALRTEGEPWEAGVTSLSVLSIEEQKKRLGVSPPPGEPDVAEIERRWPALEQSLKSEALSAITAPPAYDLRNVGGKNFITPVKDQGSCGSCVAFGTVATVEGRVRLWYSDPSYAVDLSEAHLFFCHAREKGRSCSNGWWPNEALDAFKSKGVADEACYKYEDGNVKQDCSGLCSNWADRVVKITGYTVLTGKPAQIKEWLSTKGPVCACLTVYQDFFNYKSGIYKHVTGSQAGGHCVTIVGYNDSPGYWICKNSWGTGWGEQGFFNIAYGQCGIDSWLNHGVDGIVNTGWRNNRRVIGLWAINEDRNAWVHIQGLGWRKVSPDNDNIFFNMLAVLIAAKAAARPVNIYEENGVIKQVYVY
ncbi:peptidase C1 [Methanoculleus sediminis]|uniref:Peptidase C1 n=1 Tax=Methanoculleus sediminis TaxID=1550566 RepID=A0A0H1R2K1_9EURY|nr:C1 family peptidase [Methanoculleus sediminis]KLK89415.1 peptidase C1 [Methanoculleus sediminis]